MGEHIHTHSARIRREGIDYEVRVCGAARADGTWTGWLEFHPVRGGEAPLRTSQETSQPSRRALEYWAGGLEPVYLDGALGRATRNAQPRDDRAQPPGG